MVEEEEGAEGVEEGGGRFLLDSFFSLVKLREEKKKKSLRGLLTDELTKRFISSRLALFLPFSFSNSLKW